MLGELLGMNFEGILSLLLKHEVSTIDERVNSLNNTVFALQEQSIHVSRNSENSGSVIPLMDQEGKRDKGSHRRASGRPD